ncbi:hypothetical protein Tco_1149440 [Tanacetum coccineum]
MQAGRQQRDPNRDRRTAAHKYRFNSREIRTKVDEEQIRQIRQVHRTESHKYGDEREQTTESHKYGQAGA